MVIFTCDRGEGGSGAMPGQLCSQAPTQGVTESFSTAGQETKCLSLPPASGLSWASSALPGVGRSHQRAQPSPKTEGKQGEMQTRATECLGHLGMAAGCASSLPWHNSYSHSGLCSSKCISSLSLSNFLIPSPRLKIHTGS